MTIAFEEESTGGITVTFTDSNDDAVVPTSITWTLSTVHGDTIINEREQVEVETPDSEITIVLSGDDLALFDSEQSKETVNRILTIEAVYTSDLGVGLPLKNETTLTIQNLAYIS